jgi:hypothetical protein
MLKLKRNELKQIPFERYATLNAVQLLEQVEQDQLGLLNHWMLPQILHHFGTWQAVPLDDHLLDPKATAKLNMTDDWDIGLWRVCTQVKRGAIVPNQSSESGRHYSQLVPLILAGQKRYRGVHYSRWSTQGLAGLVHKELLEVMLYDGDCLTLGSEELLQIREQGLTFRSGPKAGQQNKPTSQWKLHGLAKTPFLGAPTLLSTVLCQIWVAHPSLRSDLMILDPKNWDDMPKPLVTEEIFVTQGSKNTTNVKMPLPLPWEM